MIDEATKNEWAQECAEEGLTTPERLYLAKLAVSTFDDTGELMQLFTETGLAFNPTLQRFLQKIGALLHDPEDDEEEDEDNEA